MNYDGGINTKGYVLNLINIVDRGPSKSSMGEVKKATKNMNSD